MKNKNARIKKLIIKRNSKLQILESSQVLKLEIRSIISIMYPSTFNYNLKLIGALIGNKDLFGTKKNMIFSM